MENVLRRREPALKQDAPAADGGQWGDAEVLLLAAGTVSRPAGELLERAAEIATATDQELNELWGWPLATCQRIRRLVAELAYEINRTPSGRPV